MKDWASEFPDWGRSDAPPMRRRRTVRRRLLRVADAAAPTVAAAAAYLAVAVPLSIGAWRLWGDSPAYLAIAAPAGLLAGLVGGRTLWRQR